MASSITGRGEKSSGLAAFTRRLARSRFFASMRVRLLLLVTVALFPALLLILYVAFEQRQTGWLTAHNDALGVVRSISSLQEEIIDSTRQLLAAAAQAPCVQSNDAAACEKLFANLMTERPIFTNIIAVASDGGVFAAASGDLETKNLGDSLLFQAATNSRALAIGEYEVSSAAKKTTLSLACPSIDASGEIKAVILAAMDFGWLYRHLTNAMLPPQSSLTVIDRDGMTLARYPDSRYVGKRIQMPRPPANWTWPTGTMSKISRSRDGTMRLYVASRLGQESTVGFNVGIPLDVVYGPANRMLARNLLFLALAAALSVAAAWYGGNFFIVRRIRSLLGVTRRLSSDDLTARTNARGGGELEELSRAFDSMAASLQERTHERDTAAKELRELNTHLEGRVIDRTAALQRSNEELEQFAYVVSQDLREPLQVITQYLNLFERNYPEKLDQNMREFIGFSRDGAERMQGLIWGLLEYSRVDTRVKRFAPIKTETALRDALSNLALEIERSNARISHDVMPEVHGDAVQLMQLFQNLVSNAIRFRNEAVPAIHIGAEREGKYWRFSVRDNGIGISESNFDRIFVVFQRLHTRSKYPGMGIGLAACKRIVERHGGKIWVESAPGEGSTFYFTLPAIRDAVSRQPAMAANA